ncbi:alpha/beta fold hydrolase [bacterium]|nr:alpha/beta fold hydrolase [bacterium]
MSKPHLILIHGYAETGDIFKNIVALLEEKYIVRIPELPGFGITAAPAHGNYAITSYAEWLLQYCETNKIDSAIVAGHSFGGYLAAQFAALYPEKIKGLAFIHSHAGADSDERKKRREGIANAIKKHGKKPFLDLFYRGLFQENDIEYHKGALAELFEKGMKMPDKTLIELQYSMQQRPDLRTELSQLDVPILYFEGAYDPMFHLYDVVAQTQIMQNALLQIEPVSHMGQYECPKTLASQLKEFFGKYVE